MMQDQVLQVLRYQDADIGQIRDMTGLTIGQTRTALTGLRKKKLVWYNGFKWELARKGKKKKAV